MPTPKDISTQSVIGIDYGHHEVHSGSSFFVTSVDTSVDTASPKRYLITTPNTTKWAHLVLAELFSSAAGTWELFEDPTVNAVGSAMTEFNRNRNSGTAADVVVTEDATVQAPNNDGTLLWTTRTGSGGLPFQRSSSSGRDLEEFVLKQNEQYILKFTPDGNGTAMAMRLAWYEHTNLA